MPKEKVSIIYRVAHFFRYHPWLKLIAFVVSVIVWLYVRGEIRRFSY